ncbi:MAG: TerB family tellurite resistance protein [Candidatus Lambdaproteobacteria bacterium]|nr:TerB family tellurite resistance protein [Candidatus Lambdaproteobacteria bacterium]
MSTNFRTPIASMNDQQKEWFATAMVSMVVADGDVSQGEVQSLLASLSFIKSPETQERLKKYIHYKTVPVLNAFVGWDKEQKRRAAMLFDLIHVAIADQDLSAKEQQQFHHIGKMLGFPRDQVEHLIKLGAKHIDQMPTE